MFCMTCRHSKEARETSPGHWVGNSINTYSFNVKIYQKVEADFDGDSWDTWNWEAELAVEKFARMLKRRYKWVGKVYLTGRSGGWLAIENVNGETRQSTLETISELVKVGKKRFIARIEKKYPRKD